MNRCDPFVLPNRDPEGTLAELLEECLEIVGEETKMDPPRVGTTGRRRLDQVEAEIRVALKHIGRPVTLYRPGDDGDLGGSLGFRGYFWSWWLEGDDIAHVDHDQHDFLLNLDYLDENGHPSPVPALDYTPEGLPLGWRPDQDDD